MNHKIIAFGMATISALTAVTPALAVEQHSGDGNKVPVELTVEKPTFSVTVPTGLPVAVDAAGKVYCSTTATIKNNTFGQVKVSNVTIEGNNPWTVADWATDMQKEKVNTTKIAMQMNKGVTGVSGYQFAPENFPVMDGHGTLPLTYDAKLPAQTKVISGDTVANVVFTVGWNTDGAETPVPAEKPHSTDAPLDKEMMKAQLADLTGTITFSRDKAPSDGVVSLNGDGSVVAKISGQDATVYSKNGGGVAAPADSSYMFNIIKPTEHNSYRATGYKAKNLDVRGLDTSNVTDMTSMFQGASSSTLDLSNFDTEKVTNMYFMFEQTRATFLNLTGVNTSNVTNMYGMFAHSYAKDLDLSSFDTSKVKNMALMFEGFNEKTLNLSSLDTSNVTNMNRMFNDCHATTINGLTSFNTTNVRDMTGMFVATSAPVLDLSSFDIHPDCRVKGYEWVMFRNNTALKTVYYKDNSALAKLQEGELRPSVTTIQGSAPKG